MSVLALTIFVSLALVLFFVGGFLYHHDFSGGDPLRDSLLPFRNEGQSTSPPSKHDPQLPARDQISANPNDSLKLR